MSYVYGPKKNYDPAITDKKRLGHLAIEKDYYVKVMKMDDDYHYSKQFFRLADLLNTKASALLTHVSIMIAVSTAMLSISQLVLQNMRQYINICLTIGMCIYFIITIVALSVVYTTAPGTFLSPSTPPMDRLILIIRRRRIAYRGAIIATIIVTIFLALIFCVEIYLETFYHKT